MVNKAKYFHTLDSFALMTHVLHTLHLEWFSISLQQLFQLSQLKLVLKADKKVMHFTRRLDTLDIITALGKKLLSPVINILVFGLMTAFLLNLR